MSKREALAWSLALGLSGVATWGAVHGPQTQQDSISPDPLPRPHTVDDIEEVTGRAKRVGADLTRASALLGRPVTIHEIEGRLPNGQPILSMPLPDNPLVPGVGHILAFCPATPRCGDIGPADWCYCPESGAFVAVIPR